MIDDAALEFAERMAALARERAAEAVDDEPALILDAGERRSVSQLHQAHQGQVARRGVGRNG